MAQHRVIAACLLCASSLTGVAKPPPSPQDLVELSLEELAGVRVTSVSKRSEPLGEAPASIFVIGAEDIRRSGATTLPEVLRLAPNLQVAQVSASAFAVAARGFNTPSSNKLLVLIDGRSVYTPLFGGVFWDAQDVSLQDVERIEVISGPAGTLWGTNAVNGVINIITRPATQTLDGDFSASVGNRHADAALRAGHRLANDGAVRFYAKHADHRASRTEVGVRKEDAWRRSQAGFRADWEQAEGMLTLQGNLYEGAIGQPEPGALSLDGVLFDLDTIDVSGANVLARWQRSLSGGGSVSAQFYIDHTERTVPPTFGQRLDIADAQFEHALGPMGRHTLTWGLQHRHARDRTSHGTPYFAFLPERVTQRWTSLFGQDEVELAGGLKVTLGVRVEHNDYTGAEVLPSLRVGWTPGARNGLVWAAASRAVRAPSRFDRDLFVPAAPPFLLAGGPNVRSEVAKVFELGYRADAGHDWSYSVTVYHADYDHLRTQELDASGTFLYLSNLLEGRSSGVEMWGTYRIGPSLQIKAGFTAMHDRFRLKPGSTDPGAVNTLGNDPSHAWQLRGVWDPTPAVQWDATLRRVGELPRPNVPSYVALDLRAAWRLDRQWTLSLTGKNLLDPHGEFTDALTRTEVRRSVYLGIQGHF